MFLTHKSRLRIGKARGTALIKPGRIWDVKHGPRCRSRKPVLFGVGWHGHSCLCSRHPDRDAEQSSPWKAPSGPYTAAPKPQSDPCLSSVKVCLSVLWSHTHVITQTADFCI